MANKTKTYGTAAEAALLRVSLNDGISFKQARAYMEFLFKALSISGDDSYEMFLGMQKTNSFREELENIIKNSQEQEDFFYFLSCFSGARDFREKELSHIFSDMFGNSTTTAEKDTSRIEDEFTELFQNNENKLHIVDCEMKKLPLPGMQLMNYIETTPFSFDELEEDFKWAEHLKELTQAAKRMEGSEKNRILLICESIPVGLMACKYLSALLDTEFDLETDSEDKVIDLTGKIPVICASQLNYFNPLGKGPMSENKTLNCEVLVESKIKAPWWFTGFYSPIIITVSADEMIDDLSKLKDLEEAHDNIIILYEYGDEKKSDCCKKDMFGFGRVIRTDPDLLAEDIVYELDYINYNIYDPELTSEYCKKVFRDSALIQSYEIDPKLNISDVLKAGRKNRKDNWCFNASIMQLVTRAISLKEDHSKLLTQEDFGFLNQNVVTFKKKSQIQGPEEKLSAVELMNKHIFGLNSVKQKILNAVKILKIAQLRAKAGMKSQEINNVFIFSGPPGVGKTELAQYFCKILFEENLLPAKRFININAAELKASYVGQTAHRVHDIFESNDAIFIDECYSLCAANNGEIDSFSQEALAQLCVELEKHAKTKLIIFAGYGGDTHAENNKIKIFLKANPGIASRVTFYVDFPVYSPQEELPDIFRLIAQNSDYDLEDGWREVIVDFFMKRSSQDSFGNAREARRVLQVAVAEQTERISDENPDIKTLRFLTLDDLRAATDSIIKSETRIEGKSNIKRRIGFCV